MEYNLGAMFNSFCEANPNMIPAALAFIEQLKVEDPDKTWDTEIAEFLIGLGYTHGVKAAQFEVNFNNKRHSQN